MAFIVWGLCESGYPREIWVTGSRLSVAGPGAGESRYLEFVVPEPDSPATHGPGAEVLVRSSRGGVIQELLSTFGLGGATVGERYRFTGEAAGGEADEERWLRFVRVAEWAAADDRDDRLVEEIWGWRAADGANVGRLRACFEGVHPSPLAALDRVWEKVARDLTRADAVKLAEDVAASLRDGVDDSHWVQIHSLARRNPGFCTLAARLRWELAERVLTEQLMLFPGDVKVLHAALEVIADSRVLRGTVIHLVETSDIETADRIASGVPKSMGMDVLMAMEDRLLRVGTEADRERVKEAVRRHRQRMEE